MPSLFRNTLANGVTLMTAYGFSLILAPIMLGRLGLAQFGVWAVTGALAQYAGLMDLGVRRALSRYVALYDAQDDRRGIQECVGLGLVVVTGLGALCAAGAWLAAPLLSDALGVLDAGEMRLVLLSSVAIFVLNSYSAVVDAVPIGLRRMVPPNVTGTAGAFVNFSASIAALVASSDLVPYALANAGAAAVTFVLSIGSLIYVWSRPYVSPPAWWRSKEIISFGIKGQLVVVAELVNQQTDKIVIAMIVGPRAAGAYEIAARVVNAVRSTGIITISAMIPTATASIVERGRTVVAEFYSRYTLRSAALSLPLFGVVCVAAPYLLVAWLGEAPGDATRMMVLLSCAFAAPLIAGVAMTLVTADGKPGVVGATALLTAALNVILTIPLALAFDVWGVLLGTLLAEVLGNGVFVARFHHLYAIPAREFARGALPPTALAMVLALPYAAWYAFAGDTPDDRLAALPGLAATAGPYLLAYWPIASRLDMLPQRLAVGAVTARLRGRHQPAQGAG